MYGLSVFSSTGYSRQGLIKQLYKQDWLHKKLTEQHDNIDPFEEPQSRTDAQYGENKVVYEYLKRILRIVSHKDLVVVYTMGRFFFCNL